MFRWSRLIAVAALMSLGVIVGPARSSAIVGPATAMSYESVVQVSDDGRHLVLDSSLPQTAPYVRFDRLTGATTSMERPLALSGDLRWSIDPGTAPNGLQPSWVNLDTGERIVVPLPAPTSLVAVPMALSTDGRIALSSLSDRALSPGFQPFIADRVTGVTLAAPLPDAEPRWLSANGRYALLRQPCVPDQGLGCNRMSRWDTLTNRTSVITSGSLETALSVGDDGSALITLGDLFVASPATIVRRDLAGRDNLVIDFATFGGEVRTNSGRTGRTFVVVSTSGAIISIDTATGARSLVGTTQPNAWGMQVAVSMADTFIGWEADLQGSRTTSTYIVRAVPGAPPTPRLRAGEVFTLPVAGVGGVSAGAGAVVLNVTVTNPLVAGFVTVWPCGAPMPTASNVNFVAGQTVANSVVSGVGVGGAVCMSGNTGVDLVVDVQGYFTGAAYTGITPDRFLDTRNGEEDVVPNVAPGAVVTVPVAGVGGVSAGAGAVVLNVTVTNPLVAGFVTVWPCGAPMPTASNVNFVAGQTVANSVVSGVGVGGAVCMSGNTGVDLVVDVQGYFTGAAYTGITPDRFLDTRD